jgi:conjugal transfer pilus assembly protein TraB
MSAIDKFKQDFNELDSRWKITLGSIVVLGVVVVGIRAIHGDPAPSAQAATSGDSTPLTPPVDLVNTAADRVRGDITFRSRYLPQSSRNQGLEDMRTELDGMAKQIKALTDERQAARIAAANAAPPPSAASAPQLADARAGTIDLNARPGPIDFGAPGAGKPGATPAAPGSTTPEPATPAEPKMKVWNEEAKSSDADSVAQDDAPGVVIPVNSALEGVMLSGINARASGSISGAVGTAMSANNVGAPFTSRLKGDAILPNGWRLGDLGDCLLGGQAVAVLSAERAYAISENLSCIGPNGEVYEAPIKAYALDVDGTLGLAGKVVSKQGSLLMQAAITGAASGLGAALAPTTVPSYNTNPSSGSQAGIQFPNPAGMAYTAVGQGINQAASQLSRFYLKYAEETFPVVEVVSSTRVTWVLKETVVLRKRILPKVAMQ